MIPVASAHISRSKAKYRRSEGKLTGGALFYLRFILYTVINRFNAVKITIIISYGVMRIPPLFGKSGR